MESNCVIFLVKVELCNFRRSETWNNDRLMEINGVICINNEMMSMDGRVVGVSCWR